MAVTVDKKLIRDSISTAYDVLKQLGYEKDITIFEYSYSGNISKVITTKGI